MSSMTSEIPWRIDVFFFATSFVCHSHRDCRSFRQTSWDDVSSVQNNSTSRYSMSFLIHTDGWQKMIQVLEYVLNVLQTWKTWSFSVRDQAEHRKKGVLRAVLLLFWAYTHLISPILLLDNEALFWWPAKNFRSSPSKFTAIKCILLKEGEAKHLRKWKRRRHLPNLDMNRYPQLTRLTLFCFSCWDERKSRSLEPRPLNTSPLLHG